MTEDNLESEMILFGLRILRTNYPETKSVLTSIVAQFSNVASEEMMMSAAKSAEAIFDLFEKHFRDKETIKNVLAE